MNSFIESMNSQGARLLEFAVPMLWQSSLLVAIVFVIDFAFRRKLRAAIRYALWLVVLVKLLLPPTLALPTGAAWWLRSRPVLATQPVARPVKITYANSITSEPDPEPGPAIPTPAPPAPHLTMSGWMLIASASISVLLFAWLLFRWIQIVRMIRRASPASPAINDFLGEIKPRTKLSRVVRVRITVDPISPAVCGLFRPVVLLPQSLVEKLNPEQLRAVLLHELIHLRRLDVWVNFAQSLLQIGYWWHPLLWLANARIRRVREEAVDDAVMLTLREDSEVYAPTLLEVAKLAFNRPLASLGLVGILESKNALRQRIERLLNNTPRRAGLSIVSILGIAAFTAVAVPMAEGPARTIDAGAGLDSPKSTNLIPYSAKVDPEVFIRNIKARASETMHTTNDFWGDILLSILDGYGIDCTPPRVIGLNNKTGEITTLNSPENLQLLDQVIKELNLPGGERILNPPYGLKQVLIEAQIYQMRSSDLAQLDLASHHHNYRQPNESPWWDIVESNDVGQITTKLKEMGVQPISRPRIQTSHGIAAGLFIGDNTNNIELECRPMIQDGSVDLTVLARTTGSYAPKGGWPDFAGWTNCAIFSRIGIMDGCGAILESEHPGDASDSKLVVLLRAQITKPAPTSSRSSSARVDVSPQQQRMYKKLNDIIIDELPHSSLELVELRRILAEKAKENDPDHEGINFILNRIASEPSELAYVNINLDSALTKIRLVDLLPAIVKSADHPIKYSVLDYGVEFSFNDSSLGSPRSREFSLGGKPIDVAHFSAEERKVYQKLTDLHFDKVAFPDIPLGEVISVFNEQMKKRDPDHKGVYLFMTEPADTGVSSLKLSNVIVSLDQALEHVRAIDVLEGITKSAEHPIKFAVRDNGVEFTFPKLQPSEVITKTFEIDLTNVIARSHPDIWPKDPEIENFLMQWLSENGVHLYAPKGLLLDKSRKTLTVHATINDLGTIERLLNESKDTSALVQDGKLLFQLGKLDEAETKLNEAIKREPDNQAAYYYLTLVNRARAKIEVASTNRSPEAQNLPNAKLPRERLYNKLGGIVFDKVSFPNMSLSEVVRRLTEETQREDPEHEGIPFRINASAANPTNGEVRINLNPGLKNVRLSDVLDAIVQTADHPIKYTMLNNGIEFSSRDNEGPEMFTRTFKVNTNTVFAALRREFFLKGTNFQTAIAEYFRSAGVHPTPPEAVFFNEREGKVTVRASAKDLDLIEAALSAINTPPPPEVNIKARSQVNIKTRFVEISAVRDSAGKIHAMDTDFTRALKKLLATNTNLNTNQSDALTGILTENQMQDVLKVLQKSRHGTLLSEPQVTTLSERQAQIQIANVMTIVNGLKIDIKNTPTTAVNETNYNFLTTNMNFGITLDVMPTIAKDKSSVSMTLIPKVTEFLGYEKPDELSDYDKNLKRAQFPLPHWRERGMSTAVTVPDHHTVVLGTFSDDFVSEHLDGTLSRKEYSNPPYKTYKQLLIFVTATIIDTAGNPVNTLTKNSMEYPLHSENYYDSPVWGGFGGGGGGFGGGAPMLR